MIQIDKKCLLCGKAGTQLLGGAVASFVEASGSARLDGIDLGRPGRGMQVCAGCGSCAPDLAHPVPGLSRRAVRAGMRSATFQQALAVRQAMPGDIHAARPDAMRWYAYAKTFAAHLPPSLAGRAWANAAAELEWTQLRPIGAAWNEPLPRTDLALYARREAARLLGRAFQADFPGIGLLPATLLRGIRRVLAGEGLRGDLRAEPAADGGLIWRRDLARYELACLFADTLRRLGRFEAASDVTVGVLAERDVPARYRQVLALQARLLLIEDQAPQPFLGLPPLAETEASPEIIPLAPRPLEPALLAA